MKKPKDISKDTFAGRLQYARIENRMSQIELADEMDPSTRQQHIQQYEKGVNTPRDERLRMMAEALGVDPLWLKYGDNGYTCKVKKDADNIELEIEFLSPKHKYEPAQDWTQRNLEPATKKESLERLHSYLDQISKDLTADDMTLLRYVAGSLADKKS